MNGGMSEVEVVVRRSCRDQHEEDALLPEGNLQSVREF